MALGDAVTSALPQFQAQAESLMRDTCIIREVTGNTTGPDGVVTPTYSTVYEGKCRIQSRRPYPSEPDAGEHQWTEVPVEIHLPVSGSDGVGTGQLVEIQTSVDPLNVGRKFRVRSGDRKAFQSALRLLVEEITG